MMKIISLILCHILLPVSVIQNFSNATYINYTKMTVLQENSSVLKVYEQYEKWQWEFL